MHTCHWEYVQNTQQVKGRRAVLVLKEGKCLYFDSHPISYSATLSISLIILLISFPCFIFLQHVKNGTTNSVEHGVEPYREQFGQRLQVCCESIRFRLQAPIDGEKEALCQV